MLCMRQRAQRRAPVGSRKVEPMPFAQPQVSVEIPSESEAGRALAEARQALERRELEKAESAIRQVLHAAPEYWEAHHLQGILLAREKRWGEAEVCFRRAHQLNPAHPGPLTNLGNLCTERANYEEAIAYYHKALDLDPNYANAHHNLAVAYRRIGRIDESIRHLKKAQRLEVLSRSSAPAGDLRGPRTRSGTPYLWWILLGGLAVLAAGIWLS